MVSTTHQAPQTAPPGKSKDPVILAQAIVQQVFAGTNAPVGVKLADGRVLYTPQERQATIVLREPAVLRALLGRASDLAAGETIASGALIVTGDAERALAAMNAVAAARTAKDWLVIGSLVARLPKLRHERSKRVHQPARLSGRAHSLHRDRAAIAYHYDLSNDFYALWLDADMTYSCAYFRREDETLDEAQQDKYDLICRKLRLRARERLLDIGCGWGGLVRFAAREYGARSIGVTLSRNQAEYAQARIGREGLADRCSVELRDYRELQGLGEFDKGVSVGMVEHVGDANLGAYFASVYAALKPGGLFLNHGIIDQPVPGTALRALIARFFPQRSRFTERYIFPDGQMPRLAPMTAAAQAAGFEVRDVENLREHYTRTLREWRRRLEAKEAAARAIVGDSTYHVWRIWLAGSAHSFATGQLGVVQMLLAKWTETARAQLPPTREDIYETVSA